MRKLMNKIDRFCYTHPRFGIPNLMLIIVIGNAAVWLLAQMDTTGQIVSLLSGSSCMMASTPRVRHSFATSLWRVTATRFANNPSQALIAWAMSGAPSRFAMSLFDPKRVLRPDAMMMQPCMAFGVSTGLVMVGSPLQIRWSVGRVRCAGLSKDSPATV